MLTLPSLRHTARAFTHGHLGRALEQGHALVVRAGVKSSRHQLRELGAGGAHEPDLALVAHRLLQRVGLRTVEKTALRELGERLELGGPTLHREHDTLAGRGLQHRHHVQSVRQGELEAIGQGAR